MVPYGRLIVFNFFWVIFNLETSLLKKKKKNTEIQKTCNKTNGSSEML